MSMNNNEIINQIKDSLDIADIIGENVRLRRNSRGYSGLCPFHQEKTPSFQVYTDTQSYYCFGCHASGDVFSYVMRHENLAFPEALRLLADRAGVKLTEYRRDEPDIRDALDLAAKYFTSCLRGPQGGAARAYMKRRHLDDSDIGRYSLGYSPNSWDSLTLHLRSRGITDKTILDAGLAVRNSRGLYDNFRGRLMFAIRDVTGKVAAFGGRLIDGEGAKYVNSPEGGAYSKRRNLYMFDTARKAIREKGRSILCEGYMDALRLQKCGFTESVASLGTSLTVEQAKMLAHCSDRCYICYDSDQAGQAAAIKGMYTLAENGLNVYVVSLPEGKDPDEFLCSNSPERFEALLREAKPLVLKHIEYMKPALLDPVKRRGAVQELMTELRRLNIDDVLEHIGSLCDATALPREVIEGYLLKKESPAPKKEEPAPPALIDLAGAPQEKLEAELCFLLRNSQECRLSLSPEEAVRILTTELTRSTAYALLTEDPEAQVLLWRSARDDSKIGLLNLGDIECSKLKESQTTEDKFRSVYFPLKLRSIEREMARIMALPAGEQDVNALSELLRQKNLYAQR